MVEQNILLPIISVIIPTYRDWARLQRCIEYLAEQTYPLDRFEVLIVNNDPEDPPALDMPSCLQISILNEAAVGSYAARNAAIRQCTGSVIAFTDADCLPRKDWLSSGLEALQNDAERVAGRIELFYKQEKLTCAELYEKAHGFRQELYIRRFGASATANLITYKEVFDRVGLFDSTLMSGGDMEWGARASKMGVTLVYAENVVVQHPARSTLASILQRRKRVVGGQPAFIRMRNLPKYNVKLVRYIYEAARILRSFILPVKTILHTFRMSDFSTSDKLKVLFVVYIINVYTAWCRFSLANGISKPARL